MRKVVLLWALVIIWAVRLGTFLFRRIKKAGKDDRFDELKPSFIRFLNVWTIQALWVTFTFAAALVAITTTVRKGLDVFAVIGLLIWIFGFAFEVIANSQKSRFAADPANKGSSSRPGCGPNPATPIISARSCCGSAWRSSPCRC